MNQKEQDALTIFIESVQKPDSKLRGCAYNQGCFDELMKVRDLGHNLIRIGSDNDGGYLLPDILDEIEHELA